MKILNCRVYGEILDEILAHQKNTEYREMSDYWVSRLILNPDNKDVATIIEGIRGGTFEPQFKPYTHITFHSGKREYTALIKQIRYDKHEKLFAIDFE